LCSQDCVLSTGDSPALSVAFNADECRKAASAGGDGCEAFCKLQTKGTCSWREISCVRGPEVGDFNACVEKCRGVTVPPPEVVCGGGACDCQYGPCFFCSQSFFDESNKERVFGTCVSSDYSSVCSVFSGVSLLSKPEQCASILPVKIPERLAPFFERLRSISKDKLREVINRLIANIPEAKDFLFTIRDPTIPESRGDVDVKVEIRIDITGVRKPTEEEKRKIEEKLLRPAVEEVIGAPVKDVRLEELSLTPTTAKRQTTVGDATYVATFSGDGSSVPGPNNNNTGSSSVLAVSISALLLLFIALLF